MTRATPPKFHLELPDPCQVEGRLFGAALRQAAGDLMSRMLLGGKSTVSAGGRTVEVCRYPDGWVVAPPGSCLTWKSVQALPFWAHQLRLVLSDFCYKDES